MPLALELRPGHLEEGACVHSRDPGSRQRRPQVRRPERAHGEGPRLEVPWHVGGAGSQSRTPYCAMRLSLSRVRWEPLGGLGRVPVEPELCFRITWDAGSGGQGQWALGTCVELGCRSAARRGQGIAG